MVNYTLIIDDQIADISDKEMQVAISYSISEASNIEERTNPTTKTITLPGTKRNCKIFGILRFWMFSHLRAKRSY